MYYERSNATHAHIGVTLREDYRANCRRSRQGLAFCLEDEPQDHHFPAAEMLPGVMYNGDDQCRLRYRPDARQCDMGIVSQA